MIRKSGGQFAPAGGGQFAPARGGQFDRHLHYDARRADLRKKFIEILNVKAGEEVVTENEID